MKKNIGIIVLFFSFSLIFCNCTDEREFYHVDNLSHAVNEDHIHMIYGEEIPETVKDFITDASAGTKMVRYNKGTGGLMFSDALNKSSNVFGIVDVTRAVVVPYGEEIRYTFLVESINNIQNELLNLIIVENNEQSQEYFIKYHFDDARQIRSESFRTLNGMTSFSGDITYYDSDGIEIGHTTMSNGTTVNTTGSGLPCPSDSDDENNNNSNTNGNNQGGSNQSTGQSNNNDNSNDSGGGGEIENPDNCTVISYEACFLPNGSRGGANGHRPACQDPGSPHGVDDPECQNRCSGSATILTDWCTGNTVTFRNNTNDNEPVQCENTVGIIFQKENCAELNSQVTDSTFIQQIQILENKLNEPAESGYTQEYTGDFTEMELADPNGTKLKIPSSSAIKGMMHNHSGPWTEVDPNTNEEVEFWPVNMYSPDDVMSFLQIASNGDGTNFEVSETYSALVTFEGNYILKFKGEHADITSIPDLNSKTSKRFYDLYVQNTDNKVQGFAFYLYLNGVSDVVIYDFNSLGAQTGRYYDSDGNYIIIECL